MGITTTDSITGRAPTPCKKCGHDDGLMVLNANGETVHFDLCWAAPPPPPEPALIAHDVFSTGGSREVRAMPAGRDGVFVISRDTGADVRGIAHLQAQGVEPMSLVRPDRNPVGEPAVVIDNPSGRKDGRMVYREFAGGAQYGATTRRVIPAAEIESLTRSSGAGPALPPPPGHDDPVEGVHIEGVKPLQARQRRRSIS